MTRLGFGTSFRIFSWGGSPWHLTPKPVPRGASSATDSDVHVFACAPSQSRAASFTQPYRWISGSERCSNPIERSGPLAQRKGSLHEEAGVAENRAPRHYDAR